MVLILMYLSVCNDSWTRKRFTTRTEQVTKYCEPRQKQSMRLGTCKIDLTPPVIYITDRSKAILRLYFYLVNVFVLIFVLVASYKCTSRQRSGKGAIRKRFPLQKTRWEKTKLTIKYLYHETYRKPNEQLFSQ